MNAYLQIIAVVEMSITCAVLIIYLLQKLFHAELPTPVRIGLLLILGNVFFWPLGLPIELPLAAYVRGVTGELSIVTMLLLWVTLLSPDRKSPFGFKVAIALIAVMFYPLVLGFGMFDPYVWGYGSLPFYASVIVFAIVCGLAGWTQGVWMISLAIVAWSLHWHESANLWDYLLDPFLAIWALYAIAQGIYQKRREKAQSGYLFRAG
ncbi:hypothetical protein [Polynucleobacter antarcticus]|nr:hypothetical protein [Polynucleobacter antarcticus]